MISKIEALLDGISRLHGCSGNPESKSYQLRNPLMIRSFARLGKHDVDPDGYRIFSSLLAGYKASLYDLDLKLRGKSRAGLKPEDTLEQLLGCYGINTKVGIDHIVSFVRRALSDQSVSAKTKISFFLTPEEHEKYDQGQEQHPHCSI